MYTRYASAASSSAVVTFALLFLMQFLITLQQHIPLPPSIRITTDWIYLPEPDTLVLPEELPLKENLTQTEVEPPRPTYSGPNELIRVPRTTPQAPTPHGLPPINQFTDGPLVAMIRVAPIYPARALAREIEGYVVVQFDVNTYGLVTNVVVVESSNSVFDSAAINAALDFKFKPRIVDGIAIESYGIQNLFRFNLDDQ